MSAPPDWARVRDALADLLELPAAARAAALERLAGEEPELAAEVASLAAAADDDAGPLAKSALERISDQRRRPSAPERIGPWRLEAEIGAGGMGTVWRGRRDDGAFEQVVAIKLVRPDLARGLGDERLAAERRILATLEHTGIARLIDGGTTAEGLAYLVLEHVDGEPIDAWCDRRRLPLEARLGLFAEVASAVDFAHRKLVLHRDLKAANVLVDAEGRPKLLDFGIAKLLDPLSGDREQTVAGGPRPMTPAWASPEQLRGEPLTLASDVWALGLLLCSLTAGRRPPLPDAESTEKLARALESRGAPSLVELAGDAAAPGVDARRLAGDLARIVARALDPVPGLRYRTAAELVSDVESFLGGRPVAAHPATYLYRAGKFVRRHAAVVGLAAAVVVALVASTAVSIGQARRANVEKVRAERRFADLRELSGSFLFEFERRLRDLAGATALRRDVTATSLRYLDLLAREAGDDPDLLADLAQGYLRLGQIQGSPYTASLGEAAAAASSAERALELARRLAVLSPGSVAAGRTLAEAHQLRADLRASAAAYDEADADLAASIAATRSALSAAPDDVTLRRLLTASLSRRGTVAASAGRLDDAVAAHREALEVTRDFAREDPAGFARNVRVSQLLLGEVLVSAGRAEEALAELEPALEDLEARRVREPDNAVIEREFTAAVDRTVVALLATGRAAEALPLAESGLAVVERLSALDADNDLGRFDLVASLTQVGSAALATGDARRAAAVYRRALEMTETLVADNPGHALYRLAEVDCLGGLAGVAEAEGRRDDAISVWTRAATKVRSLGDEFPENAQARAYLAEIEANLARLRAGGAVAPGG